MTLSTVFVKYKPHMSLEGTLSLCNKIKAKNIKSIKYRIIQIVKCSTIDIETILQTGKLPDTLVGYKSILNCGVWDCIVLNSNSLFLIIYTSGHQTPLYISLTDAYHIDKSIFNNN